MRWSRVSKAYHFPKTLANCVDSKMYFQNALIHRICPNFATIQAIMAGTYSVERFRKKKNPGTEKHKDKYKS